MLGFFIQFLCLMVPKTTLRFNGSLEGLVEMSKAVKIMAMVYHSEKTQIKTNNRNWA